MDIVQLFTKLNARITYKVTLVLNLLRSSLKKKSWPWWSHINDNLVLGAIPLKNKGHLNSLPKDINIAAVLTLLEPFEWESQGPMSSPVTPQDWTQKGVAHLHIKAKDFVPLNMDQIERGVAFVHEQISLGKRVYVHCKAGRGRSATVVACYLLKYCGLESVDAALDYMRKRRPQVAINEHQKNAIIAYFNVHCV